HPGQNLGTAGARKQVGFLFFERASIPIAQGGSSVVGAVGKLQKRLVRRGRGANRLVGKDEFTQLRTVHCLRRRYGRLGKTVWLRISVRVEDWLRHGFVARPEPN